MWGWFRLEIVLASRSKRYVIPDYWTGLAADFDGDDPVKSCIASAIDFPHATRADSGNDLVGTEPG